MRWKHTAITALVVTILAVGCAPPPAARTGEAPAVQPQARKRITAVYSAQGELPTLRHKWIEQIVHAGLGQEDGQTQVFPQLAEAVPSVENGLWQVQPDGRMLTTWKIRPTARWHDGTAITAEDFVFGARVEQDTELGLPVDAGYASIESVAATNPQTVTVTWKEPYILAPNMMASPNRLLPRHLLEQQYQIDKSQFLNDPYWTDGYIGAGPFKLKAFARGSHFSFEAFDDYILGRPKVDEVELRYVADASVMVVGMLAGATQMTVGISIAPDQAAQLRETWRDGQVIASPYHGDTVAMFPQMLSPALPAILDRRFRAALLHALDREEMAATIMAGWAGVSHTQATPSMAEFDQIQDAAVRYEYDPRKTVQLLEEMGFRRGAGGGWEDASGQRIAFQNWATNGDPASRVRGMLVASDYWKQAGLDVEPFLAPPGMDRGDRAQFPALLTRGGGGDYRSLYTYFHSSLAPTASNRFAGTNTSRLMDPALDQLIGRFFSTVPRTERTQALRTMVRYHTENVYWMGYYYNPQFTLVSNRLRGVTPSSFISKGFNAHLWDVA